MILQAHPIWQKDSATARLLSLSDDILCSAWHLFLWFRSLKAPSTDLVSLCSGIFFVFFGHLFFAFGTWCFYIRDWCCWRGTPLPGWLSCVWRYASARIWQPISPRGICRSALSIWSLCLCFALVVPPDCHLLLQVSEQTSPVYPWPSIWWAIASSHKPLASGISWGQIVESKMERATPLPSSSTGSSRERRKIRTESCL